MLVACAVLAVPVAIGASGGAAGGLAAWGTLCSLCPVGFAQIALAAREVPWGLVPGVVAMLGITFIIGRAFCSWVCPSQMLKNLFGGRSPRGIVGRIGERGGEPPAAGCSCGGNLRTQGIVLAALLIISFAVGFPVFCLICPIGLAFGALWALGRMFSLLQPGWELIVFPLMLAAELFLFKRWCAAICPLGFVFGLVGKARAALGVGVQPMARKGTCASSSGCHACRDACPENLDVARDTRRQVLETCTMCLECRGACPTSSVSIAASGSGEGPAKAAPVRDEA